VCPAALRCQRLFHRIDGNLQNPIISHFVQFIRGNVV
jgi:hypothetical protein